MKLVEITTNEACWNMAQEWSGVLSVWDAKTVQKCLFNVHVPILVCQRSKILQGPQEQCKFMLFTSINAYEKSSSMLYM
jgi:hypothetical protein